MTNYDRRLIHILQTSTDPNVLSIASNDVGQYVKHYDRGKKSVSFFPPLQRAIGLTDYVRLVTDFGGKARVMELMAHPNPEVRYRALLSVQQLVSQPWIAA
jgi:V-type H+-transporting ATPase subunit H